MKGQRGSKAYKQAWQMHESMLGAIFGKGPIRAEDRPKPKRSKVGAQVPLWEVA